MHTHGLDPVMEGLVPHGGFPPASQSQRSAAQFPHNTYPSGMSKYHFLSAKKVLLKLYHSTRRDLTGNSIHDPEVS